jgi:hypothetical protein
VHASVTGPPEDELDELDELDEEEDDEPEEDDDEADPAGGTQLVCTSWSFKPFWQLPGSWVFTASLHDCLRFGSVQ